MSVCFTFFFGKLKTRYHKFNKINDMKLKNEFFVEFCAQLHNFISKNVHDKRAGTAVARVAKISGQRLPTEKDKDESHSREVPTILFYFIFFYLVYLFI